MERGSIVKKGLRLSLWVTVALALAGCVIIGDRLDQFRWRFMTLPFYVFDNAPGYHRPTQLDTMDEPVNLAIAISGGGTRASVFAAAVLEQLAAIRDPNRPGRSILDSCDVVSAVSGGSLAAAYYGLQKPATFTNPKETAAFFQRFKSHMTVDFVMRGFMHYTSHPWEAVGKYYTRYRFAQTLANSFDQYLFHGATFDDLHAFEKCGHSPAVLINATSLDVGKKFIFTNLNVRENFTLDPGKLEDAIGRLAPAGDRTQLIALGKVAASHMGQPFGFDAIDSDIGLFRVASAIAASSAYPVLPGPSALINYREKGYVHLGDGGINDNFGIDSAIGLYLARLQNSRAPRRLVVISIDASGVLPPKKLGDPNGYVGSASYAERATYFSAARGQTFANSLFNSTQSIRVVPVRLSDSPKLGELEGQSATLSISEKDFRNVLAAACEVVAARQGEIRGAIAGR